MIEQGKDTGRHPSPNGANGRLPDGRFARGNPGGPGNPHARKVAAWRRALIKAVTPGDIAAVVRTLVQKARGGDAWAVRELLDRCLGKARQTMEVEASGETTWQQMLAALQAARANGAGDDS